MNAREPQRLLESGHEFTDWIKDRIDQYGFTQDEDYVLTNRKTGKRQNVVAHDYIIPLDRARFFDLSEQAVNTWKAKHPAFLEPLKEGSEKP